METLKVSSFKEKIFDFEKSKTWKFNGSKPAIVDFYADWCAPCRALAPILQSVSQKYDGLIDIYKVDTQATPELAGLFGVRGIPSLLFIPVKGDPSMSSGLISEEGFTQAIRDLFHIEPPRNVGGV